MAQPPQCTRDIFYRLLGSLQTKLAIALRETFFQNAPRHLAAFATLIRDAKISLNVAQTARARVNGFANFTISNLVTDANVHTISGKNDVLIRESHSLMRMIMILNKKSIGAKRFRLYIKVSFLFHRDIKFASN
jgi:hypothetical protein